MLAETILKTLGIREGDCIEIRRDRLNPNRVMVLRVTGERDDS
jgi:hypothetical protein